MRLFTFGCSYTNWPHSTWADYLAVALTPKEYFNYGKGGASNQYILYRFVEALHDHQINKDDYVAVMFSSHGRYSFYKPENGWNTNGEVLTSVEHPLYKEKFKYMAEYFWSPEYALYQSWHSAFTIKKLLDTLNIKYTFLQGPMSNLEFYQGITDNEMAFLYENEYNNIVNASDSLERFRKHHKSNEKGQENKTHPSTEIHFDYFKYKFPLYICDRVNTFYQEIADNLTLIEESETFRICDGIRRKYVPNVRVNL